jgi:hypothetical protein
MNTVSDTRDAALLGRVEREQSTARPVKYGIKSLKRIGTICFTDSRAADYWAEQGYEWYVGH